MSLSDAVMLASEMPDARVVEANSLVELRPQPDRLTDEIAGILHESCGGPVVLAARRACEAPS